MRVTEKQIPVRVLIESNSKRRQPGYSNVSRCDIKLAQQIVQCGSFLDQASEILIVLKYLVVDELHSGLNVSCYILIALRVIDILGDQGEDKSVVPPIGVQTPEPFA